MSTKITRGARLHLLRLADLQEFRTLAPSARERVPKGTWITLALRFMSHRFSQRDKRIPF